MTDSGANNLYGKRINKKKSVSRKMLKSKISKAKTEPQEGRENGLTADISIATCKQDVSEFTG